MMMPNQQHLIEDRNFEGMNQQELIAMQEAILAQMGDHEDIYIDEDEGIERQNAANAGGGIMNFLSNMFWGGN